MQICSFKTIQRILKQTLQVPSAKLKTNGERTFLFAAPKLWNSLPNLIRHCSSLESFKTEIKTFLNSDFIEHLHLYT